MYKLKTLDISFVFEINKAFNDTVLIYKDFKGTVVNWRVINNESHFD